MSSVPRPGPDDTGSTGALATGSLPPVAGYCWLSAERLSAPLSAAASLPTAAVAAPVTGEAALLAAAAALAEAGLAVAISVFRPARKPAK